MRAAALETFDGDETLRAARSGDHTAFASLVEEHEAMVFSIALRFFGDRTHAEEIAQDVFVQLYRSLDEITSAAHLLFWLRQVTTRRCIDQKRRIRFRSIGLDEAPEIATSPGNAGDPILERRLRELVVRLPDAQRIALTLRYQEDLDPREISTILGLPVNTVKSHLCRALAALRSKLGDS